ncbi:MAG: ParB/RepB/Spo0J family partition protein [Proteobacteria bacterium]|nr:ParB/RepB/Spo0J family partition protein [Pseudomonadota bacterium]
MPKPPPKPNPKQAAKKPHIKQGDMANGKTTNGDELNEVSGSRPQPKKPTKDTRGLGRGLQALLGDRDVVRSITNPDSDTAIFDTSSPISATPDTTVAIDRIIPSRFQPRTSFGSSEIQELADSIKNHGIIQPLLVRPHPDPTKQDHFELIAGERRWRAAGLAKLHKVPVIIRDTNDGEAAEIALIENIQRRELNAIEEGRGYLRLIEEFGYTQEALAAVLGKSRAHLANSMRLLRLPEKIQLMLAHGEVTPGQVRPLVGREDASELVERVVGKNMTARQVEDWMAELNSRSIFDTGRGKGNKRGGNRDDAQEAEVMEMEDTLTAYLGLAVKLAFNPRSQKGSIQIRTTSLEQFEGVIKLLKK